MAEDPLGPAGGPAGKAPPISLTTVGGPGPATNPAAASMGTATGIQEKYNPLPDQEKARANIAYILLWTMVASVVFIAIAGAILAEDCYTSKTCAPAKDSMGIVITLMNLIFTPIVGLVGSVIGFYFGSKAASEK